MRVLKQGAIMGEIPGCSPSDLWIKLARGAPNCTEPKGLMATTLLGRRNLKKTS